MEEILVRKAIVEMFDGMFNADSARVHQVFHPEMRLMT
ncbi:MAG: putative lumazine-binding, partial [Bacteroidota bacterium]